MEIFPAKYFTFSTRYPESGTRIQLGNSYQYDEMSPAPDQRLFTLTLQGMAYFVDQNDVIDLTYAPERNLGVLEQFYQHHRRAVSFILEHPAYGDVVCRFNRPLELPEGLPNAGGLVNPFQVELLEQP